jgi:Zn-dependent protease
MLSWLVVLALLWPLFWCLRVLLVTRALMGIEWRRATAEAIPLENLPSHVLEAATPWMARLEAVGFQAWGGVKLSVTTELALSADVVVLSHGTYSVRALILFKAEAETAGQCAVALHSTGANGDELITRNYQPEELLPSVPGVASELVVTASMEELLQRHLARMKAANVSWWRCPDVASAARREAQVHDATLDHAKAAGVFVAEASGGYRYRVIAAVQRAIAAIRAAAKKQKAPGVSQAGIPELSADTLTEFDLQHYRQMVAMQRGKFSRRAKAVLGAVSFMAFAAVLAWQYSFAVAITLIVALIVHEGGHLLAMRWFGFRDLQLLFIPFFGGAAVGMDDRVLRPWQHIVIILAGPLPGIFISMAMLAYGTGGEMPAWFREAAITTLVLNAFNLLPVLPLDGGQIVDYAVAARFPRARVVFVALSALGMVLLGVALDGVKLLLGIGVITLMRLPLEWRLARVNRAVREEFPAGGEEEPVVRSVLAHLRAPEWAKTRMSQRLQLVRGLQNTLRMPRPGFGTLCFAALGFTAPLWLGFPLLVWAGFRQAEAQVQRAEARALAAGFSAEPAPLRASLTPERNAAVPMAQAAALIENHNSAKPLPAAQQSEALKFLPDAAQRSSYERLPETRPQTKWRRFADGGRAEAITNELLCSVALEKLRYREPLEAVALAIDGLRLLRLMESAPETLSWDLHASQAARCWRIVEEATAAGAVLSAETIAELRRLADDESAINAAAVAIPEGLWRMAYQMQHLDPAENPEEQGGSFRLLTYLQRANPVLTEFRAQAFDQAVEAKARLQQVRVGSWPSRDPQPGSMTAAADNLILHQLGNHIARLRMARVALAAMEVRRRSGVVDSIDALGVDPAQGVHPFTRASITLQRRGALLVLEFSGEQETDFDESGEETEVRPLSWRIPTDEVAARR